MPKLKTIKAMKKRYKLSATGKLMLRRVGKGHLLQDRSRKRKRTLRKWHKLDNNPLANKVIPYI